MRINQLTITQRKALEWFHNHATIEDKISNSLEQPKFDPLTNSIIQQLYLSKNIDINQFTTFQKCLDLIDDQFNFYNNFGSWNRIHFTKTFYWFEHGSHNIKIELREVNNICEMKVFYYPDKKEYIYNISNPNEVIEILRYFDSKYNYEIHNNIKPTIDNDLK